MGRYISRAKNILKKPFLLDLCLALLVSLGGYKITYKSVKSGLDPSYILAVNYAFANKLQFGKEILFTYGPLGFLAFPQPIKKNILLANLTLLAILFAFSFLIINQTENERGNNLAKKIYIALYLLLFFKLTRYNNPFFFFYLVPTSFLTIYFIKNNTNLLYASLAGSIFAISSLVKINFTIKLILLITGFLIITRKTSIAIVTLISYFIAFLLYWYTIYGNLQGIGNYFTYIPEFIKSYRNMSLNVREYFFNYYYIAALLFLLFTLFTKNKVIRNFILFQIPVFVAIVNYSTIRGDHVDVGVGNLITYTLFLIIVIKIITENIEISKKYLFIGIFVFYTLSLPLTYKNLNSFFNIERYYEQARATSLKQGKKVAVSDEIMALVKNDLLDIYPWEISPVYFQSLNWQPRPVFQSYIATTKKLDLLNAQFFHSEKAPRWLLFAKKRPPWNIPQTGKEVKSIDGRYLFNDEPSTVLEIVDHYIPVIDSKEWVLLQKDPKHDLIGQTIKTEVLKSTTTRVPQGEYLILRANLYIKHSFKFLLTRYLLREPPSHLIVLFSDNTSKRYRFVPDAATRGIWINPFFVRLFRTKNVQAVSFHIPLSPNSITVEWVEYRKTSTGKTLLDHIIKR